RACRSKNGYTGPCRGNVGAGSTCNDRNPADRPAMTIPSRHCRSGQAMLHCQPSEFRARRLEAMLDVPRDNEKSFAEGKILQSVTEGVGVVTFNNPEKRNAMSLDMWEGLGQALTELCDNPEVRVVILTGAGDKAFMSGADISQFEKNRHNAQASEEYSRRSDAQRALLANYPKPTIACIRGFCLGGGMQVAMLTDIRIAAANSQFGIPAAKLGIAY